MFTHLLLSVKMSIPKLCMCSASARARRSATQIGKEVDLLPATVAGQKAPLEMRVRMMYRAQLFGVRVCVFTNTCAQFFVGMQ